MSAVPNTLEQYSSHLTALHVLCNLGFRFLTTQQCLALRGNAREPSGTAVLGKRNDERSAHLPKTASNCYTPFNTTATPLLTHAQPWRFFFLGRRF